MASEYPLSEHDKPEVKRVLRLICTRLQPIARDLELKAAFDAAAPGSDLHAVRDHLTALLEAAVAALEDPVLVELEPLQEREDMAFRIKQCENLAGSVSALLNAFERDPDIHRHDLTTYNRKLRDMVESLVSHKDQLMPGERIRVIPVTKLIQAVERALKGEEIEEARRRHEEYRREKNLD